MRSSLSPTMRILNTWFLSLIASIFTVLPTHPDPLLASEFSSSRSTLRLLHPHSSSRDRNVTGSLMLSIPFRHYLLQSRSLLLRRLMVRPVRIISSGWTMDLCRLLLSKSRIQCHLTNRSHVIVPQLRFLLRRIIKSGRTRPQVDLHLRCKDKFKNWRNSRLLITSPSCNPNLSLRFKPRLSPKPWLLQCQRMELKKP